MANYKPTGEQTGLLSGLKAGEYPAQIVQVMERRSKCGAFEQHALRVRVEDAANEDWEDFWENLTFSDKAMWKVEQALESVGIDASVESEIRPEDWLEKRCSVQLAEKDGKLQIKAWVKKASLPAVRREAGMPGEEKERARPVQDALARLKAGRGAVGEDGLPF
jgi:hypothetical protein